MKVAYSFMALAALALNMMSVPAQARMMMVCTMDVKQCPDGSYVSRDASRGCAFKACPTIKPPVKPIPRPPKPLLPRGCAKDLRICPGGGFVTRNPARNCAFNPCPRPWRPHRPERPHRPMRPHR